MKLPMKLPHHVLTKTFQRKANGVTHLHEHVRTDAKTFTDIKSFMKYEVIDTKKLKHQKFARTMKLR